MALSCPCAAAALVSSTRIELGSSGGGQVDSSIVTSAPSATARRPGRDRVVGGGSLRGPRRAPPLNADPPEEQEGNGQGRDLEAAHQGGRWLEGDQVREGGSALPFGPRMLEALLPRRTPARRVEGLGVDLARGGRQQGGGPRRPGEGHEEPVDPGQGLDRQPEGRMLDPRDRVQRPLEAPCRLLHPVGDRRGGRGQSPPDRVEGLDRADLGLDRVHRAGGELPLEENPPGLALELHRGEPTPPVLEADHPGGEPVPEGGELRRALQGEGALAVAPTHHPEPVIVRTLGGRALPGRPEHLPFDREGDGARSGHVRLGERLARGVRAHGEHEPHAGHHLGARSTVLVRDPGRGPDRTGGAGPDELEPHVRVGGSDLPRLEEAASRAQGRDHAVVEGLHAQGDACGQHRLHPGLASSVVHGPRLYPRGPRDARPAAFWYHRRWARPRPEVPWTTAEDAPREASR